MNPTGQAPARPLPRAGRSLALQMAVIVGGVVTLVTAGLLFLLQELEYRELMAQEIAEIEADLGSREQLLRVGIERASNAVRFLASTPPIGGIARARDGNGFDAEGDSSLADWQERLAQIFVAFAESDRAIRQVRLLDEVGREQVRVDRSGAFVRRVDADALQNKQASAYFQQTLRHTTGAVLISPVELNREHGQVEEPHWATVRATLAVAGADRGIHGVIVVSFDATTLLAPLETLHSPTARFHLADAEGDFIVHPDPAMVLREEFAAPHRAADAFPGVDLDAPGIVALATGSNGAPQVAVVRPLHLAREILGGRLTMIVTTDPQRVKAEANRIVVQLLPAFAGVALLVFAIAWLLLRRQTAPIADLARAAGEVASGNLAIMVAPERGAGEVQTLATAFSQMLDALRQRHEEARHLHAELQASEAFANAIVKGSPHGILVIGNAGLIVRSNVAADRMFGYEPGALLGRPVEVLVPLHSRDIHPVLRGGFQPLEAPRPMKQRSGALAGQRADGSCFPAEISLANLTARDGRFVVATVNDVSEQHERQARAEMLASIVQNSGDFICICTMALTARYLNPAAREILGLVVHEDEEETDLAGVFDDDERHRVRSEIVPALQAGGRWSGEVALRHAVTGAVTHTMWNAFAIRDQNGTTTAWAVIGQDLAERRARASAEAASEAKSTFLAHMSHEMRTPLNAVMSVAYLLSRAPLDEDQRQLVDQLGKASRQLAALINDVLDLSKIEAGKMELEPTRFCLTDLLSDLVALMSHQAADKGLDMRVALSPDLPAQVVGDPTRLNQVLANLLSNAIKFTEQGVIKLSAEPAATQDQSVMIEFCVSDTGIGIAAGAIAHLFVPFTQADISTTRRFGGTGLGLSICKQLIESMGGSISVSSEPGVGSDFSFRLPLLVADDSHGMAGAGDPASPGHGDGPSLTGVRILVVDDSDINRDVARRLLRLEGATVVLAAHGSDAVEILEQNPEAVDLVLMDLQMPVMDGFEATRRLRADPRFATLPIIALTAAALPNERERAAQAGMDEVVTKPIDPLRMVAVLRDQLARHGHPVPDAIASASPAPPAAASGGWPRIAGINGREARARLGGDTNLLRALLRRMFSEFGDACEGRGDLLRHDPSLATQRLHKLRGIAGNLGAEHIAHLAGELETALRAGQDDDLEANGARLCEALRTLREAAAGFIGVTAEADSGESAPLDPVRLTQLYSALADNDLAALDLFSALAGALRSALGSERTARLQAAVEDLRFGDALRELEPFGSAQTPPDEGREGGSL